jgi:hypothetical protein
MTTTMRQPITAFTPIAMPKTVFVPIDILGFDADGGNGC